MCAIRKDGNVMGTKGMDVKNERERKNERKNGEKERGR